MAQQLGALVLLSEDLGSIASTHMVAYKLLGDRTVSSHLCGYQECKRCTDIHIPT